MAPDKKMRFERSSSQMNAVQDDVIALCVGHDKKMYGQSFRRRTVSTVPYKFGMVENVVVSVGIASRSVSAQKIFPLLVS